jgi:hypothetical protein
VKWLALVSLVLSACTLEDFIPTARVDSYQLEDKGIPGEDFELLDVPSGGGTVKAVHVRHPAGVGRTLFYCHGVAANIETSWVRVVQWYELGFDVFMFDYRGYGHSFGGPVAAELALRHEPGALVLESTFTSVHEQVESNTYLAAPDSFLSDLDLDTEEKLARMGSFQKLIMHGTEDGTWPVWNARELFDAAAPARRLTLCKGCSHTDVMLGDRVRYREALCFAGAPAPLDHCLPLAANAGAR